MVSHIKCPECNADMEDILLTSYPGINIKKCPRCGCEVRPNKEMTISHNISEMKLYDFKTNELVLEVPVAEEKIK